IETLGGICTKIIERNTTIPVKKSQIFSTAADGQTSVEIHVLQGERERASDNTTLGRFSLDGIAPAPRGIPQIEVTFDIDANGIVNVTALDKGTGKEQHVTITSSTNMSKEDIEKAVKDAEKFAEEDKKFKELVETRNQAEAMASQSEKVLSDAGDKISEDDKAALRAEAEVLKSAAKSDDVEVIKSALENFQKKFYEVSEKLYKAAGADAGAQGAGTQNEDGSFNADYTEK
ncbi:MAG: Hsp70 family protein, partial [Oscillospiraceae bacterium]|nr:Hsp70 family protein [Oscillospiraceae bacterium]